MAGSPIKHERARIARAAILLALGEEGKTPEEALLPLARKVIEQALAGDVASFKEIADRLDGKPGQQIQVSGDADEPLRIVHESK